ncbi:MAG: DMT family transporter [Pseudomonadota bacterium]|nr:DMT family transporter [Pseudomonadota bacterium]
MPSIRQNNLRGIAFMVFAVGAFSLMDAALKLLTPHYPPLQVAALRGLTALPLVVIWVGFAGGYAQLLRIHWPLHLFRGLLSIVMLSSFAYALKRMPLTAAYAVFFVAPSLITLLCVPLLKEKVGRAHWIAIVIGFVGVLVVLRPSGDGLISTAGLMVLLSAICYALSSISVRVLARTDSTSSMMFWMIAMLSIGATALAWPNWKPLRAEHWHILLALAITGAFGQYAIIEAFRRAQAAVAAPFEYTALAWGVALDWWLWRTFPDRWVFIGAGIIIVSGIYLLRHEHQHAEAEHP